MGPANNKANFFQYFIDAVKWYREWFERFHLDTINYEAKEEMSIKFH